VRTKKKLSRLEKALLETAEGMNRVGIMSDAAYRKIIVRHLGPDAPDRAKLTGRKKIRKPARQGS
jgi:putative transcriptional regulator